jgi:hypothetical protein
LLRTEPRSSPGTTLLVDGGKLAGRPAAKL